MNAGFLWAGIPVAVLVWLAGGPGWAVVGVGLVAAIAGNLHHDVLAFWSAWKDAEVRRQDPRLWQKMQEERRD